MTRLVERGWCGWGQATLIVLALGCGKRETEPTPSATVEQPSAPATTPAARPTAAHGASNAAPASDVVWTVPAGWKEMPARPMRKATYQAPGESGPAEVSVFYFGAGQGGGVEANITRWVQQFQDLPEGQARRDQLTVSGMAVSTVRVKKGTFSSGMPGGPSAAQENWGMNAAVVETPGGAYFFKMTGPSATVDAEEAHFTEFLRSLKSGS